MEVGNGFNFKTVVFNAGSLVLDPMKTKGALKTGKVCKNKWMQVHPSPWLMVAYLTYANYVLSSKQYMLLLHNSRTSLGSSGMSSMGWI